MNFFTDFIKYPYRKAYAALKKKLGWLGQPVLLPFRGFGNYQEVFMKGRVIEDNGIAQPEVDSSVWKNMLAMFKRYASSGISEVQVNLRFKGIESSTTTNENGFFVFHFKLDGIAANSLKVWEEAELEIQGVYKEKSFIQRAKGEILFCEGSRFGVISDIDDTILISHSTDLRKKLRLMLLKNALTRMPFDGVRGFYRALSKGSQNISNPVFYVSSSEWNLYDLLVNFCKHQQIPKGPFLLREVKIDVTKLWKSGQGSHNHKLDKIRRILSFYPHMEFILIGDSGQHDAELYNLIALENNARIKTIYIRDVRRSRHKEVQQIAHQLKAKGIEMLLVKDTEDAAKHAVQKGYISAEEIPSIAAETRGNRQAKSDFELVEELAGQKE